MKRWLSEPLLHFLLLGAGIFVVYTMMSPELPGENEIVVTSGQQEHLLTTYTRTWQRPPTQEEFSALVDDWIREELAYREGQRMALDTNDTIIRRRLRQKLELLAEDIVSLAEPDDAVLQAYLDDNAEVYVAEARWTLDQVYFSTDRRGDRAANDAREALTALNQADGPDPEALGDPLPLPSKLSNEGTSTVAALFGELFVEALKGLDTGAWAGPVRSGFGLHLVRLESVTPARRLTLEEARDRLVRDWHHEEGIRTLDALYDRLRENYQITIEPLATDTGQGPG